MYLEQLQIERFRSIASADISFIHPESSFDALNMPRPRYPNVNLLLGNNGSGKTSILKAISLCALGPAVGDAGLYPYRLVRRHPSTTETTAVLQARFRTNEQDETHTPILESHITIERKGDIEPMRWTHSEDKEWHPIFHSESQALFFVGYGANRRTESSERVDPAARQSSSFGRAQRVKSLFEEAYSLIPFSAWLPRYKDANPGRYSQVLTLVNELLGEGHRFTGEMEDGEYLLEMNELKVPLKALSDGYRAFLGWVGDLLYHVCLTCPSGKKLVDNRGIIMVDEIDLHLHPSWQMRILPTLSRVLGNLQFIVTSHSPLVVGSLEWMNIVVMKPGPNSSSVPVRENFSVRGMDADQILLTDYFGLATTRSGDKAKKLKRLTDEARKGDSQAALDLLESLSQSE